MLNVYKLGGDITSSPEKIQRARRIIYEDPSEKIVVVSAMRGVTDRLLRCRSEQEKSALYKSLLESHLGLATDLNIPIDSVINGLEEILQDVYSRYENERISLGERAVIKLVANYFREGGMEIDTTTSYDLGIQVRDEMILRDCADSVREKLKKQYLGRGLVTLVTGYDGVNEYRSRAILGRSGSDQTATFLGYALNSEKIFLLKNQKGVETADPKIVQSTLNVHHLTYDMAMEAGNLQFEAIRFAKEKRIPIEITYVQDPEIKTTIDDSREDLSTNARIKLVTGIKDCAFFEVKGIRDKPGSELEVTSLFTKYGINKLTDIDNRNSVGFVVNSGLENLPSVKSVLEKSGHEVSIDPCSLAMVVGNLRHEDVQKFEQTAWNLSEQLASASWIRGSIISSMPIQREKYEDIIRHLHYHLIAQIV